MSKTRSVLLLFLTILLAAAAYAQSTDNVTIRVTVVNKALELKNVPKFALVIRKTNDTSFSERKVSTDVNGNASLTLS
ncbi:MAG TPA: hypothetical protein VEV84_03895, partial [Pyrinomonadaceae bacterium]|nr:hypothetical protein [Pyrinomonadaceae bacterium]